MPFSRSSSIEIEYKYWLEFHNECKILLLEGEGVRAFTSLLGNCTDPLSDSLDSMRSLFRRGHKLFFAELLRTIPPNE